MKPTEEHLARLQEVIDAPGHDDERYHMVFDQLIEERLLELDPEWMIEMRRIYEDSGMGRWCA